MRQNWNEKFSEQMKSKKNDIYICAIQNKSPITDLFVLFFSTFIMRRVAIKCALITKRSNSAYQRGSSYQDTTDVLSI